MEQKNNQREINTYTVEKDFYEEMLFRYMARVYVREECAAMNAAMQQADIPDVQLNITRLYDEEKQKKKRGRKWDLIFKMGSAVAVILILLLSIAATVPTVRAAVLEFFYEVHDTHTDISLHAPGEVVFVTDAGEKVTTNPFEVKLDKEYNITYLPKGFQQTLEKKSADGISREYADEKGALIMYSQEVDTAGLSIDTEDARVISIEINGEPAMMSMKASNHTISIVWRKGDYLINVGFLNVSQIEALKVAESIQ